MVRAGELTNLIDIEARPAGQDDYGGAAAFGPWARAWAKVEPLSGREIDDAGNVIINEGVTRFTIRYLPGLTAAMRIKWGANIYAIEGPPLNTNARNIELVINARIGANIG